jgi:hypothetical protein
MGPTTRDTKPALAASGWPAGPISRRACSRERRTGERPTGGPEHQRQQISGLRGVIPRVGRIRGSQPKLGFSLFFFLFSFLSLFKFKLYSNLIQTLVTNYYNLYLQHLEILILEVFIYIYYLFIPILYLFLFSTFLEFLLDFKFHHGL